MFKLLAIFFVAMVFALLSDQYETRSIADWNYEKAIRKDFGYIIVILALVLFAGLRTDYNDTWNYYRTFISYTCDFDTFRADEEKVGILKNPAFNFYSWAMRRLTTNKTALFLPPALFAEYSFLRFFKKYSVKFSFSVYLFFTLGMFCFTMGAMKQTIAMAILTFAIEAADKKKYIKFAILVFLAFLFHTYAIVLIVVPFLRAKPWSWFTWAMVIVAVLVFNNLEAVLGNVIDAAEEGGKKIYQEEILGGTGSNMLRIAVYAVPPLLSIFFRKNLFEDSKPIENTCVHLSILSFACMAYGLVVSGNMSDRLATYYEVGTLIALPWMLEKSLNKKYYQFISLFAYPLFFVYFYYKFGITEGFDSQYKSILSNYF